MRIFRVFAQKKREAAADGPLQKAPRLLPARFYRKGLTIKFVKTNFFLKKNPSILGKERKGRPVPEPSGASGRETECALHDPNPAYSVGFQLKRRKRTERRTLFTFSLLDNWRVCADVPRMAPEL